MLQLELDIHLPVSLVVYEILACRFQVIYL